MSMKLYGFWRSIATYRVRVALRLKGVAFEELPINLFKGEQFSADYEALNPAHALPTLIDGERTLTQSMAIMEYLEETHPAPALLPTSAPDRAYVRALALGAVADAHPMTVPRVRAYLADRFGASPQQIEAWAQNWLGSGLASFEATLAKRPPAPFVMGAAAGLADICIVSHAVAAQLFHLSLDKAPHVMRLRETCEKLDAFALSHPLKQPGAPASV